MHSLSDILKYTSSIKVSLAYVLFCYCAFVNQGVSSKKNEVTLNTNDPLAGVKTPADALRTCMEWRGWSQPDLAYVLGVNVATVNQIINGKRGISPDMAKALAVAFNVAVQSIAAVQAQWELDRARDPDPAVEARARVQTEYPLREMIKRGWLSGENVEQELCQFFDVNNVNDVPHLSHAAKKTVQDDHPPAQLAWLHRVRQIANEMPTPPFTKAKLNSAIEQMHSMRASPEEVRHVPRLLHEAGVRFVVVEGLPSGKIDGACFWIGDSPVIGMSMRFDRIDNFWFVLRHECSHVAHGHGKESAIIDTDIAGRAQSNISAEEKIADSEALNFCVAQEKFASFYARKAPIFSERDVIAFAGLNGVHPGLVIGQLQHKLGRFDFLRRHLVSVRNLILPSAMVDGWGDVAIVNK
jgi:HTH-type transcriptional regulator / antitoxin HigA